MCRELLETYGIKAATMMLEFDDESPPLHCAVYIELTASTAPPPRVPKDDEEFDE